MYSIEVKDIANVWVLVACKTTTEQCEESKLKSLPLINKSPASSYIHYWERHSVRAYEHLTWTNREERGPGSAIYIYDLLFIYVKLSLSVLIL